MIDGMIDESAARDRDETRRLIYAAIIGIRACKPVSPELAASIVNAIAHHSDLVNRQWGEELAVRIVLGHGDILDQLHQLIDSLDHE